MTHLPPSLPVKVIGLPSQPTTTRPAGLATSTAPAPRPRISERRHAIEAGMLGIFLRGTIFRQRVGGALMLVFAAFCYAHVYLPLLLTWLAAGIAVLALRNQRERAYDDPSKFKDAAVRADFVRRLTPIYALHGGVWGLSLCFCFDRIPLYDQLGCWMVLACVASAPLTSVALLPRLCKAYTNTLFALLILTLFALSAMRDNTTDGPNIVLLGLPLFYWWLLHRFGRGIYQNQSEQFGLQYDIAQKEREARAAVDIKNRFLAAASHDMRQPVMALSLYAEHLVDYPEMHLELAPKIAAASTAVKKLFESLFDLSNLDSGQVALNVEPVDIADVLAGVRVQFEPLAAAKNITLRLRGRNAIVHSDHVRLQRMIGNVVGNAIKYSPPDRKILIAARTHASGLRVEIWDQGYGIPAKDIDKVFQEFYRVDRADMPAIDGVGLGLSLVSRLSRVLNTQVKIGSVEGRGTRFTFCIADVGADEGSQTTTLDIG